MNNNGGGGGGRRNHGAPPPRNGRKERDEDLLLFREMHKREKERIVSLLQPVSDEFEANGTGNYPLYRMNASAKKGSSGYEFLAESEKNDYDWLKTPPATPLFPSLEMEGNAPELAVQREIPIIQPLSRFSESSKAAAAAAGNGRQKSPMAIPKSKAHLRYVTPSHDEKPNVPLSETKISKNHKSKTSTDFNRKSITTPTTTAKAMNRKEISKSHGQIDFLTSNLSQKQSSTESSKTKPRSRDVSPLVRSTIPAQIPGFSDQTPPNLRTDRSLSASRGRSSNPTTPLPTNVRQKPESTVKTIRRQSCSPSVTRGRNVEPNVKQESDGISSNQRGRIQTQTGNGTQFLGSRMVEKVMNARKLGAEERESAKPKSRTSEGSGFGRIMSKSSLDMALKHMEIKTNHNNFRNLGPTPGKGSRPSSSSSSSNS